jgi:hypothetical protein
VTAPTAVPGTELRVEGATLVAYRLYDLGYAVHLDRALDLLAPSAPSAPERARPVRGEAQAIQIANPPITVVLGTDRVALGEADDGPSAVEVSARVFDFGTVSLRLCITVPDGTDWPEYGRLGHAIETGGALAPLFDRHMRRLADRIRPAVERPALAAQTEDYIVYRVARLVRADGAPVPPDALGDDDVAPLLLSETRPLSAGARRELLPHRFSYYPDDLAILTWDNALIVEPRADDTDVQFLLEFANASSWSCATTTRCSTPSCRGCTTEWKHCAAAGRARCCGGGTRRCSASSRRRWPTRRSWWSAWRTRSR